MLLLDAETRGREIIEAHFDALLISLFGARFAGLDRERVEELFARGLINTSQLNGLDLQRDESEPLNPILFIRRLGSPYAEADSSLKEKMREWDIDRWRQENILQGKREERRQEGARYPLLDRPLPPLAPVAPNERAFPPSFGQAEKAGLVSAFQVSGGYIRGLGASYVDEFRADLFEEWDGENLLRSPDPIRRRTKLEIIREEVATAVLTKAKAEEVGRRLRQRTKDMARNFERIAETEIQAVHNEGQIYQAVDLYGEGARVARIPESGACKHCLELFIDPKTSEPYIFGVLELAANGSNVGRKRRNWKATAFPVHPNCRCDVVGLSPEQKADRLGRIKKV